MTNCPDDIQVNMKISEETSLQQRIIPKQGVQNTIFDNEAVDFLKWAFRFRRFLIES